MIAFYMTVDAQGDPKKVLTKNELEILALEDPAKWNGRTILKCRVDTGSERIVLVADGIVRLAQLDPET